MELEPNTRLPALLLVVKHLLSKGMSFSSSSLWPFYLQWCFWVEFLLQKMLQRRCV